MMMVASLGVFCLVLPYIAFAQSYQKPVPTAYHLKIHVPDLTTADSFNGSIEINITLTSSSTYIIMHAENLTVNPDSVSVLRESLAKGWVVESRFSGVSTYGSLLNITFAQPVLATNYRIKMDYTGYFQGQMRGFAKVPYYFNKEVKYLGVTSFEPSFARTVFPCFDDIAYRTNFVLDVSVNKNQTVLSNVLHAYVHNVSEFEKMYHFDTFPAMPVYQLGWAIYEFSTYLLHSIKANSTTVHTRAPSPYSKYTSWSCDLTAKAVDALGNYTQQPYHLEKIEQIVVPEFFAESSYSWGILSYSEEAILFSPGMSSARDAHRVALELSRGIAQQWFGGFISMKSWNDQWFAKGMAEYLMYIISAKLQETSKWELNDHIVVELVQTALSLDNGNTSLMVSSTDEKGAIENAYKDVTGLKGGAIIRMMQSVIGEEVFSASLNNYLKRSALKTSDPTEFWNDVYEIMIDLDINVDLASQSVTNIVSSWTFNLGHPVVNVTWNGTHYNISQPLESQLFIPITYVFQESPSVVSRAWILPGSSVALAGESGPKWILVNINQTGFFRVNYDSTLLSLLSHQLMSDLNQIPRLSRAQLLDDVFALTHAGLVSTDDLLSFTSYLVHEVDYFPWHTALRNYQELFDKLYNKPSYKLLQEYLLSLMEQVIGKVGMVSKPQDSHTEKLRQTLVLEKACSMGHPDCVKKAVSALQMTNTYYDADINMAFLCVGVSNSSSRIWHEVWNAYYTSKYPAIRSNILKALACSRDTSVLNGFLTNVTLADEPVLSSKDKTIFLKTLASTPYGAEVLLDWLLNILTGSNNTTQTSDKATTLSPILSNGISTLPITNVTYPTVPMEDSNSTSEKISLENSPDMSFGRIRQKRDILNGTKKPSEDEAATILKYIAPKLTTLQQGTKIESFLQQSNLNLSNQTMSLMREVTAQIYENNEQAQKYNGKMTVWLSKVLTEPMAMPTTQTPGSSGSTKGPKTSKPNTAAMTYSSLMLTLLSVIIFLTLSL